MPRIALQASAVALLGFAVFAQQIPGGALRSVTGPIRHAGVYHVATGTWTRGSSLAGSSGPDTIYNNTCTPLYYLSMVTGNEYQHRARIPSTSGPTTDSSFYGTTNIEHRYDAQPSCHDEFTVNGFEFAYCTIGQTSGVSFDFSFASVFPSICDSDMTPQYSITVSGLPVGAAGRIQTCWIVDVDLSGEPGGGFQLSADGDGTYDGVRDLDDFGFGIRAGTMTVFDGTGPLIAGDWSWTGGPGSVSGVLSPCTGTDGSIWERPMPHDFSEGGTGMASEDFIRVTGTPSPYFAGPGCLNFNSRPHADFYTKLFADPQCYPLVQFCSGGVAGIISCPCGNPQIPAGSMRGCNNFGPTPPGGTGGAVLDATGYASVTVANDTLKFVITNEILNSTGSTLNCFFQGTTTPNVRSGAGIRCVGGTLKRIYHDSTTTGSITFPNPNVPDDPWTASHSKSYDIVPGQTIYYYSVYRNGAAVGQPGCPDATFKFNTTNAGAVLWHP